MKLKKVLASIVTIAVFCIYIFVQNAVYAGTAVTAKKFKVIPLMTDNPSFGYAIGNPKSNGSGTRVAATIWNIVEENKNTGEDIFCLREGLGFANIDDSATYDYVYDMKTEKSNILREVYNWNKTIDGVNQYSAILAALDLFYINNYSSPDYKAQLIKNAGIHDREFSVSITDKDIKAVEQAVLWYFTNYGENDNIYNQVGKQAWLNYTEDGTTYTSLSDYNPEDVKPVSKGPGAQRQTQAERLYEYLVSTAKANAPKYDNLTNQTTVPATIDKSRELGYEEVGSNYIVGPFKVTETANNTINYTVDVSVKNGSSSVSYQLVNANKSNISSITSGEDFYLSIPKNNINIENLKINLTIKYSQTTLKLWTKSGNQVNQQPVVIPEKEEKTIPEDFTIQPIPEEKVFDLALRKYITKINDVPVQNSREPSIEYGTLNTGTTATYKHRKDPVTISTGDKVTYKLTIYNEGEKRGRATKVVDQLPTGLTFKRVVSGNFEPDTSKAQNGYNTTSNTLYLKRKSSNTDDLDPYVIGDLDSETIEIECEVTAKPDSKNQKVLTNVAWISEEFDAEDSVTITNERGKDRDSEPSTSPENNPGVNKDNMDSYKGNNSNKNDLSDSGFYYEGQQDDDDFEKLVLLPETFDLKLIKRIVAVNDQNVPERIESVDVSKLNTLDENGDMITTGDYKLSKDPVPVKKGDIVTYTFRIYNEGTIDGYAQEITEDVPEGLEFVWSSKTGEELAADTTLTAEEKAAIEFNQKFLWGKFVYDDSGEKIIQISSDYLSKDKENTVGGNLIKAFGKNDGTKTEKDISYKELSVKFKVVSDDTSGNAIKNEAWISDDADKDGGPVDDRDSDPKDSDNHPNHEDDEDHDYVVLQAFDLSLRKFIVAVSSDETIAENEYLKNEDGSYQRAPVVDTSKLNTYDADGNFITTAEYKHTKQPVRVKVGDYVVYMMRVYNEGDINGYATCIRDWLPPYLEFVDGEFNKQYGWVADSLMVGNSSTDGQGEDSKHSTSWVKGEGRYTDPYVTDYLKDELIEKAVKDENGKIVLTYKEVPILCRVTDNAVPNENITNIGEIALYESEDKQKQVQDRDSKPLNVELPREEDLPDYKGKDTNKDDLSDSNYYYEGQEDEDDFEKVIVQEQVDLSLRKFIVAVSKDETVDEDEYLKNEDGSYQREPIVDTSKLNTLDENGNLITTAEYKHPKTPVTIPQNSIVVYMIRVYNEGDIDAYASEVKDHLPPYLEFVDGEFNKQYGWSVSEDGRTVTTRYLENTKLDKISTNEEGKIELDYADIPIMCKLTPDAKMGENITNIADITEYLDENKKPTDDRDSQEDNVKLPNDEDLPDYKGDETGDYIPGQQDDDDFEKVVVQVFDLALRKFIVAVSHDTNIEESEYLRNADGSYQREPVVDTSKLNTVDENGNLITTAEYKHTKEPVLVQLNDIVIYMLRVYNEGDVDGYAGEIKDHLPQYLEFVDGEFNDKYGWELLEDGRTVTTRYLENTKLNKITVNEDGVIETPDYADVPIMCKVKENAKTNENITNIADIAEYLDENKTPATDRDSQEDNVNPQDDEKLPSYKDDETGEYIPGQQDDDDFEKVVVKIFDLALRKWVTQAIVIDDDGQHVTETGHQPYDDPEQVVKVELHRKKVDEVVVKFRYSIRVINEGDIAGYAKEVTDYIPEGLKFVADDNPGWTDEGNNVISTRALENTLLQPGEYADVEVVLTWINNQDNMGVKTNVAEISEDENEYGIPDKDSTPDNQQSGEDDIDDAPVMLAVSTGRARVYFTLILGILITVASGIALIKKFVI